ncbi:MAG: hypothetical protein PWP37_537 [Thermotogota bacterium]|nr:hypothetical protein [Thermotogota bacterium]MDK2864345.1 hypothetical protein [Thermotogota bacterium]HCZ05596.1 pilus assembly protein PilZ [Thermotogota bacterium]
MSARNYYVEKLRSLDVIKPGMNLELETDDPEVAGNYRSTIHDILNNGRVLKIAMPTLKGRIVPLPNGTRVYVKVPDKSAIYTFYSTVMGYRKDDEGFYVTFITLPEIVSKVQRRHFVRIPVVLDGEFKLTEAEERVKFVTKDFSAGGAAIVTSEPLVVDTIGEVVFDFKTETEIPPLKARVVREAGRTEAGGFVYGIQFLDVDPPTEKKLVRLVFELERNLRKVR